MRSFFASSFRGLYSIRALRGRFSSTLYVFRCPVWLSSFPCTQTGSRPVCFNSRSQIGRQNLSLFSSRPSLVIELYHSNLFATGLSCGLSVVKLGDWFYRWSSPNLVVDFFRASGLFATGLFAVPQHLSWMTKSFSFFPVTSVLVAEPQCFQARSRLVCLPSLSDQTGWLVCLSLVLPTGEADSNLRMVHSGARAQVLFAMWTVLR